MKDSPFTGRTTFLFLCFIFFASYFLRGQSQSSEAIHFEAEKGIFDKPLLHGKAFKIESTLPKTFTKSKLHWWFAEGDTCKEPEKSNFTEGIIDSKMDAQLRRKVFYQVSPLAYSASYCFSLHVYQEWGSKDDTALEASVLKIVNDSLKAKAVFPHRIIREDLGPLAGYWVNSEGKTLQMHTIEWFDETREYQVLKVEAKVYLKSYFHVQSAVRRKLEALNFFKQNHRGPFPTNFGALEQSLLILVNMTAKLPHGFNPESQDEDEKFLEAERRSEAFVEHLERELQINNCSRGVYSTFCHLLSDLSKEDQNFRQGFKTLTTAYKRKKHAWSTFETKLAVFTEETRKLLTNPILLSGEGHVNADTPQGKRHISFSFGALTAFGVHGDQMFKLKDTALLLYGSVNFYFSPADTTIPLAIDGGFGRRFSFNLGMTISEIYDAQSEVGGIVMNRGLITGFGYRVSDNLKIGLGLLWYEKVPNRGGRSDLKRLDVSPYLGLAIDLDLLRLIFKEAKKAKDV